MDLINLTPEEVDALTVQICIDSEITDEDLVLEVQAWIQSVVTDANCISMLSRRLMQIVDYKDEGGFSFKMTEECLRENQQYRSPGDNPIWQQIAEIGS